MLQMVVDTKEMLKDENLYGKVCNNCGDVSDLDDCRCCSNPDIVVYEKCVYCHELFEENSESRLGCCSSHCYETMMETVRDDVNYEYDMDLELEDLESKYADDELFVALYIHFEKLAEKKRKEKIKNRLAIC